MDDNIFGALKLVPLKWFLAIRGIKGSCVSKKKKVRKSLNEKIKWTSGIFYWDFINVQIWKLSHGRTQYIGAQFSQCGPVVYPGVNSSKSRVSVSPSNLVHGELEILLT